jgi:hypothetical protein
LEKAASLKKNDNHPKTANICSFFFDIINTLAKNINAKPKIKNMEE